MTGHRSDETNDRPQEHHSDAESLRHIPHHDSGVVQDGPGTSGTNVQHGEPNRQNDPQRDDNTNGG